MKKPTGAEIRKLIAKAQATLNKKYAAISQARLEANRALDKHAAAIVKIQDVCQHEDRRPAMYYPKLPKKCLDCGKELK